MAMKKELLKGNIAIAEAAIRAGCRYFFGYPITPQNEIPMYFSHRLPEVGGVFVQAESEVASVNMVFGASAAGARVMTTTSSPGYSLMQEGISYIAAAELPSVFVNIVRGGPGLGNIAPAQSDYFQATRGGGHGDYRLIVLAGNSVQELADLTFEAFDLADKYRNPVLILGDGLLGQMSEPVVLPDFIDIDKLPEKPWALKGAKGEKRNIARTLWLHPENAVEMHNEHLHQKYEQIKKDINRYELYKVEDADIIIVAYGSPSRIARSAIDIARQHNIKAGLIRLISLWPFPESVILEYAKKVKKILVVEMSKGQLIDDVKIAANGNAKIWFLGRAGGWVPTEQEIFDKIKQIYDEVKML